MMLLFMQLIAVLDAFAKLVTSKATLASDRIM